MEIRNVTTFVKIVEFGSFTRAADNLGYSQAAVTVQIKAMESELGVPLFDRINKKVYLTQEGKTFLPHALNMLKAEEEAVNSVKQQNDLTGELRICAPSSYAMSVMPALLLEFRKLHPLVSITLNASDFIEDSLQKLNRSEIDFLIRLDREMPHPELLTAVGKQENVVFVTWPGNPLLNKKNLTLSDIAHADFIVSGRSISYSAQLEREFISKGIEFRPVMDIGSVGAIINMLLSGYGVSFLPEFTVRVQIKKGELVALKLQDEISVDLYASYICNPDRWINPVMKEFIRIVQADRAAGI